MKGLMYIDKEWPVPVFIALCICPKAWDEEMKRLDVKDCPFPTSDGRVTEFSRKGSGVVCIVTLNGYEDRRPLEVAGLLFHEAGHCWQVIRDYMKEDKPGVEHEAYTLQIIGQRFLELFVDMGGPKRMKALQE